MRRTKSPIVKSVICTVKNNKKTVALMIFMIALSVISALLPPLVLEKAVNLLTLKKAVPIGLAVCYMILIILSDIMEMAQNSFITIFGQKVTHGLRSFLAQKLNTLSADYYAKTESGKTASVFVNDADTIDSLFSNGIVGMFADVIKLLSVIFIIFTRSKGLAFILIVITPFIYIITRLFQKNTLKAQSDNRVAIAKVNNHVPETIKNIRMIHVFKKESFMEQKYDEYISKSYDAVNRSNFNDSVYSPIIIVIQAIVIAVLMTGAVQGIKFEVFFGVSVGSAVALINYVSKIFSPIESIGMEIQNIQSAMAGIKHINEFLLLDEYTKQGSDDKSKKGIVFDNVNFGYSNDTLILKNLSFMIAKGEHVTIMGRTGAGKSTIFKLLLGLYNVNSGSITLNGIAPCNIKEEEKRLVYGCVEQEFKTVEGTLRNQISLYDSRITDDMIWSALNLVMFADEVKKTAKGLDTPVKDVQFSKGEYQLLSIARAVVLNPQILLLDEITANLDSRTEYLVLNALKKACEGRTVISISHRCSTVMKDERIISL